MRSGAACLRRADVCGAASFSDDTVLCASPGGGYRPPAVLPATPRTYLVAGLEEPFFRRNAAR